MNYLIQYKSKYHFSVNFWSILLVFTFVPDLLGIDNNLIKYGFWALRCVSSFWVVFNYKKKIYHLNSSEKLFFFVIIIFFINIFIDVLLENNRNGYGSAVDLAAFAIAILVSFSFRYDPRFSGQKSFNVFAITLALGLFIAFFLAVPSPLPWVGRMDANSSFNTINYGQLGCAMSLVSIYSLTKTKNIWHKILWVLGVFLGLLSIMKAGSRSPIVVLFVVVLFFLFAKSGFSKGLILSVSLLFFLWFMSDFLIEIADSMGSSLPARILSALESGESSGRDKIYANTLSLINDSLYFGDSYLIPSGIGKGGYPHNYILEAFLTCGLFGGIPFLIMLLLSLYKSYNLLRDGHQSGWIVVIFVQLCTFGMFSSSLSSSQDFWALSFFILSIDVSKKNINKKRILN